VLESHAPVVLSAMQGLALARTKRTTPAPPIRALVVDDEESVRRFVNRVLIKGGYETVVASGGSEAESAVKSHGPFDVLVTDLVMPEMSGDELVRRLRQNAPQLKVLYLTGFSDHLFKEKATLWADEAFLDKPCSVSGLLEAVSLLVSGRIPGSDGRTS
jgi:two-component system cell cycle sensor histidine kinase/response regulator CckA